MTAGSRLALTLLSALVLGALPAQAVKFDLQAESYPKPSELRLGSSTSFADSLQNGMMLQIRAL